MLASFVDVISPSGPSVSIRHTDGKISISIHTPQHIPLEYPRDTFIIILLRCAGQGRASNLGSIAAYHLLKSIGVLLDSVTLVFLPGEISFYLNHHLPLE